MSRLEKFPLCMRKPPWLGTKTKTVPTDFGTVFIGRGDRKNVEGKFQEWIFSKFERTFYVFTLTPGSSPVKGEGRVDIPSPLVGEG